MRVLVLWLLLPGCLYVGSVNRAPSASLTVEDVPEVLIKGAPAQLHATMHDPEDGNQLRPIFDVKPAGDDPDFDPNCDALISYSAAGTDGGVDATVRIFRTGTWVVTFSTVDKLQAPSNTDSLTLTVVDAPPKFVGGALDAQVARDPQCNTYTAGQPLPIYLPDEPTDDDLAPQVMPGCDMRKYEETLTYRWEIVGMPADASAKIRGKPSVDPANPMGDAPCPPDAGLGASTTWTPGPSDYPRAVCVYPDRGGTTVPAMYEVAVYVSDGTTEVKSQVFEAPVRADLPPCVTGAQPAAGSYVVDRLATQPFDVTGAIDDLDPFGSSGLTFVWSVWREQDPVWRTVPDWPFSHYELDTSGFAVGEKVRVRAEPADRSGARASCDPDMASCVVDSCLTQTCDQWVTWDLELR